MHFVFAFDGPDASGKSMISQMVREDLYLTYKSRGFDVQGFRMPGGTPLGGHIRSILKNPKLTIHPLAERFLFAADTADFFHMLLSRMRDNGLTISLIDRWSPVTDYMYGIPRGVDAKQLAAVRKVYMNQDLAIFPDALFLVLPSKVDMLRRMAVPLREKCRIEQLGSGLHETVWQMYADACWEVTSKEFKHCLKMAHKVVPVDNTDADRHTVRDVANGVLSKIKAIIEDRFENTRGDRKSVV